MRIIIAHNHYGNFATGGEGASARQDYDVLRKNGHDVYFYEKTNFEVLNYPLFKKFNLPTQIIYSRDTYKEATKLFKEFKPDILHVNNYKFVFTPSIFQAAKDCGVKTVLTLRNYLLLSPCGMFCQKGKICERCLDDNFSLRYLWNPCGAKANSFLKRLFQYYFYLGTSSKLKNDDLIDAFIALTPFSKSLFVKGGIPDKKVYVRPNFMSIPNQIEKDNGLQVGAVCVGRLSIEKGVDFLIDAWKSIDYPLTVIGEGPLEKALKASASPNITFTGNLDHQTVMKYLVNADFLVFPSVCYENFPRSILEAFSMRLPVIASDLGGRKDIITHEKNGLLFKSLDKNDFQQKVKTIVENPVFARNLGEAAYKDFVDNYTPDVNYNRLIHVYSEILGNQ